MPPKARLRLVPPARRPQRYEWDWWAVGGFLGLVLVPALAEFVSYFL
jgi:hypothetical protein